jgi:2-methylcitrate dehydratase PrpD
LEEENLSLSLALAERSRRDVEEPELDRLRVLSLTNVAAAAGDLGSCRRLIADADQRPDVTAERARRLAMAFHARTQDDFFPAGRMHVGAIALAVALAHAEVVGDRLLECVASGYETICRVSATYSADAQARGMRPSGMFGPLGAAATAAAALELDEAATANAISLAATMSAGTNQAWIAGTDEWLLEVGAAARAGVEAVELTLAGARAAADGLEGRAGWARAFFDDEGASRLVAQLDADDAGIAGVAIKPYPVSGIAQVPTWLGCRAHGDELPTDVRCEVSEAEFSYPGSSNRGPFRSRSDALMSIALCVGAGLADGIVELARLESPNELADLVGSIEVAPAADLAEGSARLRATAPDGTVTELNGSDAELLFPAWGDLGAEELAIRSEAPLGAVAAARATLAELRPSAPALAAALRSTANEPATATN